MSKINEYILDYTSKDYGSVDASKCELDYSLGVNCTPLPDLVVNVLRAITPEDIKFYPHDAATHNALTDAIREKFVSVAPELQRENILYGGGSFDLLSAACMLYANANKKVMGHAPQFGAYVDFIHMTGAQYVAYNLSREKGWAFDGEEFVAQVLREQPDLIVCENPNNPTGQILGSESIRRIIDCAAQADAAVLFDEAYGDYLPLEESAVGFIEYGRKIGVDVLVSRTFSKAYGMAGMRLGYILGPAPAIAQLGKIVTPFNAATPAKKLALAMLNDESFRTDRIRGQIARAKAELCRLIEEIGPYRIARTTMTTPIFTLYVEDENIDLEQRLGEVGVCTVSCASYDNMGKNAVRVMFGENYPRFVELLRQVRLD